MLHQNVRYRTDDRKIVDEEGHVLVNGLYWLDQDFGAWEGPSKEWVYNHSKAINKYVKTQGVVVQAGGNLGMYPKLLAQSFERVITFEPDPLNFYVLNLNCPEPNITKFNAGLGASTGNVGLSRPVKHNVGMHKVSGDGHIPIVSIDVMLELDRLDLLMLDIEGYELHALKGAEKTILKHRPVIFTEAPTAAVNEYMADLGYTFAENSAMDAVWIPSKITQ
jgi:FkbM family methyltransferase